MQEKKLFIFVKLLELALFLKYFLMLNAQILVNSHQNP